jgi:hypothetical protein
MQSPTPPSKQEPEIQQPPPLNAEEELVKKQMEKHNLKTPDFKLLEHFLNLVKPQPTLFSPPSYFSFLVQFTREGLMHKNEKSSLSMFNIFFKHLLPLFE